MSLLNEIQQKLKVPKNQFNAFGKYNYRNAEDILEAVKPLLGDAELTLSDEVVQVGQFNYVKATARLKYGDGINGGIVREAVGWAREPVERKGMDDSQITGAASSYARKYALNGLFCIDDTKDADNHDNRENAPVAPKNTPRTRSEAENRELAAKDRIKAQLVRLGKLKPSTTPYSPKDVSQAVFDVLGVELIPEKYEEIGEELSKVTK